MTTFSKYKTATAFNSARRKTFSPITFTVLLGLVWKFHQPIACKSISVKSSTTNKRTHTEITHFDERAQTERKITTGWVANVLTWKNIFTRQHIRFSVFNTKTTFIKITLTVINVFDNATILVWPYFFKLVELRRD